MSEEKSAVLMIDDEHDIVNFFGQFFKNFPLIDFLTTMSPVEGIELARQHKPKVVMIDLRMPEMNGEEALQEMKKFLPDAKFIVMTGWDDRTTKDFVEKEIGVEAYYQKPIDFEKVIAKVMSCLMVKGRP